MEWEIAKVAHIGGREEQQDQSAFFSNGQDHLLVLADGMGGHEGGKLAAHAVIEAARLTWQNYQDFEPMALLYTILVRAEQLIDGIGAQLNISPHSTCVILYLTAHQAYWTHLGDSRLYHFRRQQLLRRTQDHSVVQMLVDLGRLHEHSMANHPDQGRLLKWLGGNQKNLEPDFGQTVIRSQNCFVLCSDGFWERISPQEMSNGLQRFDLPLSKIAKHLVANAVRAGGPQGDNVSVILARPKTIPNPRLTQLSYWLLGMILLLALSILPIPYSNPPLDSYGNQNTHPSIQMILKP